MTRISALWTTLSSIKMDLQLMSAGQESSKLKYDSNCIFFDFDDCSFGMSKILENAEKNATSLLKPARDGIFIILKGHVRNPITNKDGGEEEFIADGYLRYGTDFFSKIIGEFCFVLFDQTEQTLFVVRDRFGSHLLFCTAVPGGFALASEIKGLMSLPYVERSPNWGTIYQYLFRHYRYAYGKEETFFKDVFLLPPNSITTFKNCTRQTSVLWEPNLDKEIQITDEEAIEAFHFYLEESFKRRMDPLRKKPAFLLSGGLDSTTISALAALRASDPIQAFSICYDGEVKSGIELFYDEREYIKPIAAMHKMKWKPIFPRPENFEDVFDEMLVRHDEPISSPTWFSHFELVRSIKQEGFEVVFGGDGGDHALAGLYDDVPYFLADLELRRDFYNLAHELEAWQLLHDHPLFPKNKDTWERYKQCFDFSNPGRIIGYTWDDDVMHNNETYARVASPNFSAPADFLFPSISSRFLISKLWQDLLYSSSPPSTRAEDINFATFGVTCVSIFQDQEFMEFCWSLPGNLMIRNGYMKWLIRVGMQSKLPEQVLWRKEHVGLNAPANIWFRDQLRHVIVDTVNDKIWESCDLFNNDILRIILAEHLSGKKDHMMFLWRVLSVNRWLKRWGFA